MDVKVLFIAGWGRSGSTILSSLLGQLEGFQSIGELQHVWSAGLLRDRLCGCSAPFRECAFWKEAMGRWMYEPRSEIERLVALREGFRTRHYFQRPGRPSGSRFEGEIREYAGHLMEVYRRIQSSTGCSVIVDSSKAPSHGHLIDRIQGVDLRVLHLVRDPRAVAFSWRRKKVLPAGEDVPYMRRQGPIRSSLNWAARNFITERLWADRESAGGYLRLHYEDFVRRPRETLVRIRDMAGERSEIDFFTGSRTVSLRPTHQFLGNPSRFQVGEAEIAADQEWSTRIAWNDRLLSTVLPLPMLIRYGYVGKNDAGS